MFLQESACCLEKFLPLFAELFEAVDLLAPMFEQGGGIERRKKSGVLLEETAKASGFLGKGAKSAFVAVAEQLLVAFPHRIDDVGECGVGVESREEARAIFEGVGCAFPLFAK